MSRAGLRLRAVDAEDLAMISALLQDALVELTHFTYDPAKQRFGGVFVRFMHEERQRAGRPARQVKCAIAFDSVRAVRLRGVKQTSAVPLELLALSTGEARGGQVHVTLRFAGGGSLRLEATALELRVEDVGDPWVTSLVPSHGAGA